MVELAKFERWDYAEILYTFACRAGVRTVLELGICTGISSRALLAAVGETGRVWSVEKRDSWSDHMRRIKERFPAWVFILADDLEIEWDREVDLLFIDTSHTYEHTLAELIKFSPFVRNWIFLHDTKISAVSKAIEDFVGDDWEWIVAEWSHRHGLALLTRRTGPPDGAKHRLHA